MLTINMLKVQSLVLFSQKRQMINELKQLPLNIIVFIVL